MGLTVAFAQDLAKHAPLDHYYLMRVIATGDRASSNKLTHGQDLHKYGGWMHAALFLGQDASV